MADLSWSPEKLFQACATGSDLAWGEFRRRYGDQIRGVTYRIARRWNCLHQLDDLIQDVYTKFCVNDFAALRRFTPQHANGDMAYVCVVAANEVSGKCRQVSTRADQTSAAVSLDGNHAFPAPDGGTSARLVMRETEELLRRELPAKTADRDLAVFRLYYIQGFTATQIASLASLDLSVAGVESLLFRCRKIITPVKQKASEKGMLAGSRYSRGNPGD